eukprot:7892917-Ditylum_brightwellii.AAC.1
MSPTSHLTFLAMTLIQYNVPEYSNYPMDHLVPGRGEKCQAKGKLGGRFQDDGEGEADTGGVE